MMHSFYGQSWGLAPAAVIGFSLIGALIFLIVIVLKGYSLWYAARRGEKWWFVALLILNTVGILELIYLIFVVKKWHKGTPAASTPSTPATPSAPTTQA